jgi:hypothetical protein
MSSTKHRRKIVTQSVTMSQNNKEHRIHNKYVLITLAIYRAGELGTGEKIETRNGLMWLRIRSALTYC